MNAKFKIKNARIFKENGQETIVPLEVKDGILFEKIDPNDELYLIPTAFDLHVHFREPGLTWKEDLSTGSLAAMNGGVSVVLDMPNTKPPTLFVEDVEHKRTLAKKVKHINVLISAAISNKNIEQIESVSKVVDAFKVYLDYTYNAIPIDLEVLDEALDRLESLAFDKPILFHAVQPSEKARMENDIEEELEGVKKVVELAKKHPKLKMHVTHVSCAVCWDFLLEHSPRNLTRDTSIRYIEKVSDALEPWQRSVNPPLRDEENRKKMLDLFCKARRFFVYL